MATEARPDDYMDSSSGELTRALRWQRTAPNWKERLADPNATIALGATRKAIEIEDGTISAGGVTIAWYSEHIDDVLVAFLEVIRRCRGDVEAEVTGFRRVDIVVLAEYLDLTGEEVLGALSRLLGSSSARVASMEHLYKSGAGMILTGVGNDERREPTSRLAQLLNGA